MNSSVSILAVTLFVTSSPNSLSGEQPSEKRYIAESPGWYWVYQSIAQSQSFLAVGSHIEKLDIRVAKLNANTPQAPLEVEVRDPSLKQVFAHGKISAGPATRDFQWRKVSLDFEAKLQPGRRYLLLFHSQDTNNKSPWLVNAIYRDVYPHGRRVGGKGDLFFSIHFSGGRRLHVGPNEDAKPTIPTNSGLGGGAAYLAPLALYGESALPKAAEKDPLGKVPRGERVGTDRLQ